MLERLAIITGFVGLILSVIVCVADIHAVGSSIIMIAGVMIILSIPFGRISKDIGN